MTTATLQNPAASTDAIDDTKLTIEEAYRKYLSHLTWLANLFSNQFRRDFDDTFGECQVVFVKAYEGWTPGGAPFRSYLHQACWYEISKTNRRDLRLKTTELIESYDDVADEEPSFSISDLLRGVGDDARAILEMALDAPEEIEHIILNESPTKARVAIKRAFRSSGWGRKRLNSAIQEIKEALQS